MIPEISRISVETLGRSPIASSITRQTVDVVVSDNDPALASAATQVSRTFVETLGSVPPKASITRQTTDVVVVDADPVNPTLTLQVSRTQVETLAGSAPVITVTRQTSDVVVRDNDPVDTNAEIHVSRISIEALGRHPVALAKATIPAGATFFAHNWADSMVITSTYGTNVCKSPTTLTESRRGTAEKPARNMAVRWTISADTDLAARAKANDFLIEMRKAMREDGVMPFYPDMVQLDIDLPASPAVAEIPGDFSRGRFFNNSLVVIVHTDHACRPVSAQFTCITQFETNRIFIGDNLASDIQRCRAFVMPVMLVHKSNEITIENLDERTFNVTLEVDEIYGPFAIPPTASDVPGSFDSYRSIPILGRQPNRVRPVQVVFRRDGSREVLGRGLLVEQRGDRHVMRHRLDFTNERREVRGWEMVQFWDSRRGRLRSFWQVEYENVWRVNEIDGPGGFIGIQPLGDFAEFERDLNHIGLVFNNGREFVSEVISIQVLAGQWRLTIDITDNPMPSGQTPTTVKRVGRAFLARNRSDSVRERWTTDGVLDMTLSTEELLNEGEITLDP